VWNIANCAILVMKFKKIRSLSQVEGYDGHFSFFKNAHMTQKIFFNKLIWYLKIHNFALIPNPLKGAKENVP
jgi:hypothetical protein